MDPPLSVSSGSCFSTLPSGLQPGMTSSEACTSWLLGVLFGSVGNFVPSAQPNQAVPVPAGYPVYDQSFHRPPYQPQADFFNTFSYFMSSMLDRVQGIANPAVTQQPLASQDLSQPSGASMNDSGLTTDSVSG